MTTETPQKHYRRLIVIIILIGILGYFLSSSRLFKSKKQPETLVTTTSKVITPLSADQEHQLKKDLLKRSGICTITFSPDHTVIYVEYDPDTVQDADITSRIQSLGIQISPKEQLKVLNVEVKYN